MTKTILIFFTSMLSVPGFADPLKDDGQLRGQALPANAEEFVETYYEKAAIGLSDDDIEVLYSRSKLSSMARLVAILAHQTGQPERVERHRILELVRMNAKCESRFLKNTTTLDFEAPEANLFYLVTNTCVDYMPVIERKVGLRYTTETNNWQIDHIQDGEPVQ